MISYMCKRVLYTVVLLTVMVVSLGAQTSTSSYFLKGSYDRHILNPALSPERGYISMPALGGVAFEAQSNVGLSNFLYPSISHPDMLTTFMSSEVDANSFLSALPTNTMLGVDLNLNILSFGFGSSKGYTTFGIRLNNREDITIPKELFRFMKAAMSNGNYSIRDIAINSSTYADISLGHSHRITDNLRLGVNLHLLAGLMYANLSIPEIKANLSGEEWVVNANGDLSVSAPVALSTVKDEDNSITEFGFDGLAIKNGLPGIGFSTDIGAEYNMGDIVDGLMLSASVTDIGLINWNESFAAGTSNSDVKFSGFENYDIYGDEGMFDPLKEDFQRLIKLYERSAEGTITTKLNATLRVGVDYTIPVMRWLSFGELFSYKMGMNGYYESRTAIVLAPVKWFDMNANVAFNSRYGMMCGCMLNLHPVGLNLFLSADCGKLELTPQFIPTTSLSTNLMFGVRIPVGNRLN